MTTYYRGPNNDNFGYDPELVTQSPLPFGSEDPWDEMEHMEWVHVSEVSASDEIVESGFLETLLEGATVRADKDDWWTATHNNA